MTIVLNKKRKNQSCLEKWFRDKQEEEKYTGNQSLVKVDHNFLPNYLIDNYKKYEEWFD